MVKRAPHLSLIVGFGTLDCSRLPWFHRADPSATLDKGFNCRNQCTMEAVGCQDKILQKGICGTP